MAKNMRINPIVAIFIVVASGIALGWLMYYSGMSEYREAEKQIRESIDETQRANPDLYDE